VKAPVRPNVELHIEELVLHGFSPHDRWRIADAVQSELARSIAEHGIDANGAMTIPQLNAGTIQVAAPMRAHTIGAQVGRALHGALRR
jgi:hypothetical protein